VVVVVSASGERGLGGEAAPGERNAAPIATAVVSAARIPTVILTLPSHIFSSSHVDAWIEAHTACFLALASTALTSNVCSSRGRSVFVGEAVTALL
jgi:hypothetical protein